LSSLTVLLCQPGSRAAKLFSSEGVKPYSSGMWFEHASFPVSDILSLSRALEAIAKEPRAFVVRGEVKGDSPTLIRRTYREKKTCPAYLDPSPRDWAMFDLDKGGPVVEDGNFERAVVTWKAGLPEGMREATCYFTLSASAHLSRTLRGHAWFYLDRPYSDGELKDFAKRFGLDPSLYQPSQPHYTADPVFLGLPDPLPRRAYLVRGLKDYATISCPGGARLRELGEKRLAQGEREIRKDISENKAKHPIVNRWSYHLGKLCPHILSEAEVFERLSAASRNTERDLSEDIRQGLEDGKKEPELAGEDWRGLLAYAGKEFKPAPTVANVMIILQHDLRVEGLFSFDSRASQIKLTRSAPYPRGNIPADTYEDVDGAQLSLWLQTEYDLQIKDYDVSKAVEAVARDNKYDPILDYLDSIEWDGTPRLATLARDCLGCLQDYESAVLRLGIISLVKRAYEPGCQSDHTVVLEGGKGIGKTTFLQWLGGDGYSAISDQIGKGKDAIGAIHSAWLADFSEMSAMKRGDAAAIKDFLTTRADLVRLPYDRRHSLKPRRCGFFATMNPEADKAYILDDAMARRLWPIEVLQVNRVMLTEEIRDQILAEACSAYKAGESSWELADGAQVIQLEKARQDRAEDEHDPWVTPVFEYLRGREYVQAFEVLNGLQVRIEDHLRYTRRISRILKSLGWCPTRATVGRQVRMWCAPVGWCESYPRTGSSTLTHILGAGLTIA
jgi:predicted P-loop ATPase